MPEKILSAIDIGTNSFHLVTAKVNDSGIVKILTKEKEVVRLGKSSTDMKYLSPDAMERAVSTLKRFKIICDSYGAQIRAVATSAVREALNRDEFIYMVSDKTGIQIEVVSGFEEARLIYLGVLQSLSVYDKRILMMDIGGGSTEFLVGQKGQVKYANSVKLGAVRLTEKFFSSGNFDKDKIEEAKLYTRLILNPVIRQLKEENYEVVIGTSGTITNLGSVILNAAQETDTSDFNFNNFSYTGEELHQAAKKILKCENVSAVKKIEGVDSDRADIITAGAIILEQIFTELDIKQITLASYALREGIIFDTIDKTHNALESADLKNIRYRSIINLAKHSNYDIKHVEKVLKFAEQIFNSVKDKFELDECDKEFLEAAAILHDIGHSISQAQHHRHSYYLIKNSELLGYNNEEIEIIANVARYHRKSHPKQKHTEYYKLSAINKRKIRLLSGILRIADGLDRGHNAVIEKIEISIQGDKYKIKTTPHENTDPTLEIWGADLRKGLFEEAFGYSVEIV
ncbi:MAG: Ppx/GppA phosphatase family protein [Ignavibacteria bacterium]|nr:Ppx/GppA phosphatase family protein [Ignavibacteria bacterium]